MENLVFTQLSVPEVAKLIRGELETFFANRNESKQQQAEADQLLTIQQAAEFISLSVPTIYGLVSRSEIPCMKKGKRLYFSKEELTNWIRQGRKKTVSELAADADLYLKKKGGNNG